MKKALWTTLIAVVFTSQLVIADPTDRLIRRASRVFGVLPEPAVVNDKHNAEKVALGKQLFSDPLLSSDSSVACATCHPVDNGKPGADNQPVSTGANGQRGDRNAPTVFYAALLDLFNWDGRTSNLVEQIKAALSEPTQMSIAEESTLVTKLKSSQDLTAAFAAAFTSDANAINLANTAEAIAAYLRTLRSSSRFDDFVNGDKKALSSAEQRGMRIFIKLNCVKCHEGPLVGGNGFEKLGEFGSYPNQSDLGRYRFTNVEDDRMVFRVPPLRNVALTAPYYHDGQVATLEEAVQTMALLQLDRRLTKRETADITSFLKTLTDKHLEDRN